MCTVRPNPHNPARIALAFAYLRANPDDPTLVSAGLTYLQIQDHECLRKISRSFFYSINVDRILAIRPCGRYSRHSGLSDIDNTPSIPVTQTQSLEKR